jgi:hypothetical protein
MDVNMYINKSCFHKTDETTRLEKPGSVPLRDGMPSACYPERQGTGGKILDAVLSRLRVVKRLDWSNKSTF